MTHQPHGVIPLSECIMRPQAFLLAFNTTTLGHATFWLAGWLVGYGPPYPVDQVLNETLMLFQAARERRCHVHHTGIEPGWLNLETSNSPLNRNTNRYAETSWLVSFCTTSICLCRLLSPRNEPQSIHGIATQGG